MQGVRTLAILHPMTAVLLLLIAIGLFWALHWTARHHNQGFAMAAFSLNAVVILGMVIFAAYGIVIGYRPTSPHGLDDYQAQWHIAITWFIGPLTSFLSFLVWTGYLINHYRHRSHA